RAKVVVIDITGVAAMDSNVANHLVQTVEASRLLGATVIVTGLSPEIAQTLVTIGVDLSEMATVGDLQGGIEEAERLLGYKVLPEVALAWGQLGRGLKGVSAGLALGAGLLFLDHRAQLRIERGTGRIDRG